MFGRLHRRGWFAEQPDDLKQKLQSIARLQTFRPGQYLYHAGDVPNGIFGLRSGSLEIEFPLVADSPVTLLRKNDGMWIGDSALLSNTNRTVSIVAVQECSCVYLPGREIKALLKEEPHHWSSFYDLSARNTLLAVTLLAESLSLTVRARVCRMLMGLSQGRSEAEITQDALATMLGIARPTLRRCLIDLTSMGVVEIGYGKIKVIDKKALESFKDEQ